LKWFSTVLPKEDSAIKFVFQWQHGMMATSFKKALTDERVKMEDMDKSAKLEKFLLVIGGILNRWIHHSKLITVKSMRFNQMHTKSEALSQQLYRTEFEIVEAQLRDAQGMGRQTVFKLIVSKLRNFVMRAAVLGFTYNCREEKEVKSSELMNHYAHQVDLLSKTKAAAVVVHAFQNWRKYSLMTAVMNFTSNYIEAEALVSAMQWAKLSQSSGLERLAKMNDAKMKRFLRDLHRILVHMIQNVCSHMMHNWTLNMLTVQK